MEKDEHDHKAQSTSEEKENSTNGSMKDYLRIYSYADKLDWCLTTTACIASCAAGTTLPLMTIIFGQFINKFNTFQSNSTGPEAFRRDVSDFVLWFVYLFFAKFCLIYISSVAISVAAIRTTRNLRQSFFEHTLRQEVWHFDIRSGAIATQVTTNTNSVNQGIADKVTSVVQYLSTFVAAFIIAVAVQWKLALITFTIIPLIFVVTGICVSIEIPREAEIVKLYSQASTIAQEALSSIKILHAYEARGKIVEKYDELLEEAHVQGNKKSPNFGALFCSQYFCLYAGIALCFWQGFRMFQNGEIADAGKIFTVMFATLIASTCASSIIPQITAFTNAAAAASELFVTLDKQSLLDPLSDMGRKGGDNAQGNICIENLKFAYPSRPDVNVLRDFSLLIPAGKTTALVGASGSGKSTIIGLLERWYLPSSGQIVLDGFEISDYNTEWLRSTVRLVQQEPTLFQGSIFHNVCHGLVGHQHHLTNDQKMALVQEACRISNADGFIRELPDGYHTEVGERAGRLSGGQRQRIAIARSIISNPKVLLLDEATSALDAKSEHTVQAALNKASENRTTLVIAHKLATIKAADNIAVMDKGTIVEQGTHAELLAKHGHYAALVLAQDLGGDSQSPTPTWENLPISEPEKVADDTQKQHDIENQEDVSGTLGLTLIHCLWIMLKEQRSLYGYFALGLVACMMGGAVYPVQAILFSKILSVFVLTGQQAQNQANFYALIFFVVALSNLVAYFSVGWVCNHASQAVTHVYRREMFENILRQDIEFFDQRGNSSGALTSKLSSLPQYMQELMGPNVLLIVIVGVNLISSSFLAIAYGWKLGLVVVFGGLPAIVLSGYLRVRLETSIETINGERFAESASLACEVVQSIRTVASLTMERPILEQYTSMLRNITQRSIKSLLWTMFWFALSQSLDFLVMALGFWYGGQLLASGAYTTDQFFVIFIGVLFAGQAAAQFFGFSTSFTKAVGAANYILWLRTLKPKTEENELNRGTGPIRDADIEVDNVDFAYRQREASRVLRGLTMTIESGQSIGVVGASGCGKSSLISLLERFYDPSSGRICLGDQNIAELSPITYRSNISIVLQEPVLYQGTVRENIALGLEHEPTDEQVIEACRQANCLEFISSLPEGFKTPCGIQGNQFSGGQRQRICLARAIIRQPRILLLDEATSALDTQSEKLVQTALERVVNSRTTVAVAHRLSTIKNCDMIFVLEEGKIVEMGTHSELQKLKGVYYEMCLAQALDQS